MTQKTKGQIAYELDCGMLPHYHDGTLRRPWAELPDYAKESWERNPTPRASTPKCSRFLTQEERAEIIANPDGLSIIKRAAKYGVTRRAVQLILNPDSRRKITKGRSV